MKIAIWCFLGVVGICIFRGENIDGTMLAIFILAAWIDISEKIDTLNKK